MVIQLAAMRSIPGELYESDRIDGASMYGYENHSAAD